jgi:hypothetical protein
MSLNETRKTQVQRATTGGDIRHSLMRRVQLELKAMMIRDELRQSTHSFAGSLCFVDRARAKAMRKGRDGSVSI